MNFITCTVNKNYLHDKNSFVIDVKTEIRILKKNFKLTNYFIAVLVRDYAEKVSCTRLVDRAKVDQCLIAFVNIV